MQAYMRAIASLGDEYVCNLAGVLLRFCAPFLRFKEAPPAATLEKLDLAYLRTRKERVDYAPYSRLAGVIVGGSARARADDADDADDADAGGSLFAELDDGYDGSTPAVAPGRAAEPPPPPPPGGWTFVGEVFFLTQFAFHVGLVPTIRCAPLRVDPLNGSSRPPLSPMA